MLSTIVAFVKVSHTPNVTQKFLFLQLFLVVYVFTRHRIEGRVHYDSREKRQPNFWLPDRTRSSVQIRNANEPALISTQFFFVGVEMHPN